MGISLFVEGPGSYPCGKRLMNIIVIYCDDLCGKMQISQFQVDGTLFLLIVFHSPYCAGDKIEKNEMGWACGAYG